METEGDLIIREAVEAMSREMKFYKESKRRTQAMSVCDPKTELTQQQKIAFQNSTCDPLLKQMAKSILGEIQYNRNQRGVAMYFVYGSLVFIAIVLIMLAGLIYREFNKSSKRNYGTNHQ